MNTWRGAVVLLVSALAGSAGMLLWAVTMQSQWMPLQKSLPPDKAGFVQFVAFWEGLSLMLGPVFATGRITAMTLIHRKAADEIARSGRWRTIPLHLCTGTLLVVSRFAVFPPEKLWTWDHVLAVGLGGVLVLSAIREMWVCWVAPHLGRSRATVD